MLVGDTVVQNFNQNCKACEEGERYDYARLGQILFFYNFTPNINFQEECFWLVWVWELFSIIITDLLINCGL